VFLQFFEGEWDEIHRCTPGIAEAGTTTGHQIATGNPPSPSHHFYRIVLHLP